MPVCTPSSNQSGHGEPGEPVAELKEGLARLTLDADRSWHIGTRLRNYFLTGLVIVGPVTVTIYIAWWFINVVDASIKPFLPRIYNPETYLPFPIPGFGLIVVILGLIMVGALAANLLGRTLISYGEIMVGRMPIVRNVYRTMKQIFESVITASGPDEPVQKVGLIEFPSKGIWSIVFVTGETSGAVLHVRPGGHDDLLSVFMPTGIVPPTGFVCFVPRKDVTLLHMSMEDAAKVIISGGMVMPETQERLKALAVKAKAAEAAGAVKGESQADRPRFQPQARGGRRKR
jgi:uncharacterized membrane protein